MVQRTVLKVDISCLKCKKKLIKAVSGLEGVDKVEADAAKGTLTVTGECDPYEIIVRTRKVGKFVEVVSIGPPPAPPKPPEKKPEQKKEKPDPRPQHICMPCDYAIVTACDEPNPSCSIL
ncbi:PREDICTED: heavy [Prunus dulcis]|uniref:PREDICTED: heavy n=1 Tax=Prunus dulcis TaxID=3755 RepID=A0A5E4E471_PRUDU|nr:heavy metal-associated isoprenylated plant protein 43-like [Prunus dulcis]VVA09769.1 PREDICTED: heavy [Prunus dulcis]